MAFGPSVGPAGGAPQPSGFTVARWRDGVDLQFSFVNLHVDTPAKRLVPSDATKPSFLVVELGPQHVEEVGSEVGAGRAHRAAAPSRLVFRMPAGFAGANFKLDEILDLCARSQLNVAVNAISDDLAAASPWELNAIRFTDTDLVPPPDATVTAVELPFRLLISPNEQARFAHAGAPVSSRSSQRVELWHTRLGVAAADGSTDERASRNRSFRAIYTRDLSSPVLEETETPPAIIRSLLVKQSSDWAHAFAPPPSIPARKLILTPLGGTLDAHASWETVKGATLRSWTQRTSIGRDDYVQATLLGYLLPFGHRAICVMTSRRQQSGPYAPVIAKWQIQALDAIEEFSPGAGEALPPVAHRRMPFQRIRLKQTDFTIDALDIRDTTQSNGQSVYTGNVFAVRYAGAIINVPVEATDRKGRTIAFDVPLIWVLDRDVAAGADAYNNNTLAKPGEASLNHLSMNRQRIALAPSNRDTTTVEVDTMDFSLFVSPGAPPAFYPAVTSCTAVCEAARHFAGNGDTVAMHYHDSYAPAANPNNLGAAGLPGTDGTQGQVLVSFGKAAAMNIASAETSGGLVLPSASIQGIGMQLGPISDLSVAGGGGFDPAKYFAGAAPKLFGRISITDLIPISLPIESTPKFITEGFHAAERYYAELQNLSGLFDSADSVVARLDTLADAAAKQAVQALKTAVEHAKDLFDKLATVVSSPSDSSIQALLDALSADINALAGGLPRLDTVLAHDSLFPDGTSGLRRGMRNELAKVIPLVKDGATAVLGAIKKLQQGLDAVRDLKAKIEWRPAIPPSSIAKGLLQLKGKDPLYLSVEVNGKAPSPDAGTRVFCSLDGFDINFPPSELADPRVVLTFDRIFFRKEPLAKPEIDVAFHGISFHKEFEFIEGLRSLLPLDGFSDPPFVDVDAKGIRAGFSAELPNVALGLLSLQNLKLAAELDVPFLSTGGDDDALAFKFDFCDRDHPFLVTVAMLGGGGYFSLELASTTDAIRKLEASVDLAAQMALDIGVASGSVSVTAGIVFAYDGGSFHLTGFADVRGALDILGIVHLSIEAKLELTYDFGTTSLVGSCTLTVDVEVAFISKSVDLHFEQRFTGGGSPAHQRMLNAPLSSTMLSPTFHDLMRPYTDPDLGAIDPWADYLAAFAP